jgi:hypothetical protein
MWFCRLHCGLHQSGYRFPTFFCLKVDLKRGVQVFHQSLPERRLCQIRFLPAFFADPYRQIVQPAEQDVLPARQWEKHLIKHANGHRLSPCGRRGCDRLRPRYRSPRRRSSATGRSAFGSAAYSPSPTSHASTASRRAGGGTRRSRRRCSGASKPPRRRRSGRRLLVGRGRSVSSQAPVDGRREAAVPGPLVGLNQHSCALADPADAHVAVVGMPAFAVLFATTGEGGHRP